MTSAGRSDTSVGLEPVFAALTAGAASAWARAGDAGVATLDQSGGVIAAIGPARHVLAAESVLEAARARFGSNLAAGDQFVHNDPYTGGTAIPDLSVVAISDESGQRRFGLARMRLEDAGGGEPGGVFAAARQVIQEGDRVPAVRIAEHGAVLPDLVRRLAINNRCRSMYGRDLTLLRQAAEAAARAPSAAPAGAQGGAHDGLLTRADVTDGMGTASVAVVGDLIGRPRRITVRITVRDGRFEVDFEGTAEHDAGPGNIPWSVTVASTIEAIRAATEVSTPLAAISRAVTCSAPAGTFVRPAFPAACSAGGLYSGFAVRVAVARALAAAGFPRVDWPTWSAGAVVAGPPMAEYSTLVPLDCRAGVERLTVLLPDVTAVQVGEDRWGRRVDISGPLERALRVTSWRMEIEAEGPAPLRALKRNPLPASVWLSSAAG